jgi:hypothetical protein
MPKTSKNAGASIAGLTEVNVPSEADYTDAMTRHGSDKFTEDDAATVRAWLDQRARTFDPHAEPAEVENAVAQDATAKASHGPDAKGYADQVLEGAQTGGERVEAKAEADKAEADKAEDDESASKKDDDTVTKGKDSATKSAPTKATGSSSRSANK